MTIAAKLLVFRAVVAVRMGERRRRRRLERELAAYSSPADRLELESIMARYAEGTTAELRSILARQDAARALTGRWPAVG